MHWLISIIFKHGGNSELVICNEENAVDLWEWQQWKWTVRSSEPLYLYGLDKLIMEKELKINEKSVIAWIANVALFIEK